MRQRIQVKIELGVANKVIANQCNVPLRTVQEYARNMRHYGTVRPPKEPSQGRPRIITPEMEEVLLPSFQNFINFRRCSIRGGCRAERAEPQIPSARARLGR